MRDVSTKAGLGIRASIVRYGNPRLLLEFPAYVRAHRATGASGRILVSLPEHIYGDEAVVQNRLSAVARHAREEWKRAWKRILRDLFTKLTDGRLVAYGSLDSSLNPKVVIQAAAWKHLALKELRESTLREGRKEHERLIYSVSIFPTLEAQCAADVLVGQSIVTTIKQHVLNDPEAVSLINRMSDEGTLSEQFLRRVPLGAVEKSDFQPFGRISAHSKIQHRQTRCVEVLRRRLYFLRALLKSGKLIVQGVSAHTSALSILPPDFWNQSHVYIDLGSGEVYYRPDYEDEFVLILKLPTLQREGTTSSMPIAELPPTVKTIAKPISATAGAKTACKEWLAAEMRASPDNKPRSKAAYFEEARARWGQRISKEAFDGAWATALDETGAKWGKPGRPRKSRG
jgi:hypothetical protein